MDPHRAQSVRQTAIGRDRDQRLDQPLGLSLPTKRGQLWIDQRPQFGVKIHGRCHVMLQDMGQHQRVGQAVGDMELPPQRISKRMHASNRRIGKSHARKVAAKQHGAPRRNVRPILDGISRAEV